MKIKPIKIYLSFCFALTIFCLSSFSIFAFDETKPGCPGHNNFGNKTPFYDIREKTLPFTNELEIEGGHDDNINIKGTDRSDISIRACVRTWNTSEKNARDNARKIIIETDSIIRSKNLKPDFEDWDISYEILVPKAIDLKLKAHNGDIKVNSVNGRLSFVTKNGDVVLKDLSGKVRGKTKNGEVTVNLSGETWIGESFDVETYKGNVNLAFPKNYAANFEIGTLHGNFLSELQSLKLKNQEKAFGKRFKSIMNGGGASIRLVTTNGDILIK